MTWENHGKGPNTWQIDHIVPVKYPGAAGGEPTLEEVAERLHWTNCQPMWTTENIAKGNRFIGRERAPEEPKNEPAVPLTDADVDELIGDLL